MNLLSTVPFWSLNHYQLYPLDVKKEILLLGKLYLLENEVESPKSNVLKLLLFIIGGYTIIVLV